MGCAHGMRSVRAMLHAAWVPVRGTTPWGRSVIVDPGVHAWHEKGVPELRGAWDQAQHSLRRGHFQGFLLAANSVLNAFARVPQSHPLHLPVSSMFVDGVAPGRDAFVTCLEHAFEAALAGTGDLKVPRTGGVALCGMAEVGKTHILHLTTVVTSLLLDNAVCVYLAPTTSEVRTHKLTPAHVLQVALATRLVRGRKLRRPDVIAQTLAKAPYHGTCSLDSLLAAARANDLGVVLAVDDADDFVAQNEDVWGQLNTALTSGTTRVLLAGRTTAMPNVAARLRAVPLVHIAPLVSRRQYTELLLRVGAGHRVNDAAGVDALHSASGGRLGVVMRALQERMTALAASTQYAALPACGVVAHGVLQRMLLDLRARSPANPCSTDVFQEWWFPEASLMQWVRQARGRRERGCDGARAHAILASMVDSGLLRHEVQDSRFTFSCRAQLAALVQ